MWGPKSTRFRRMSRCSGSWAGSGFAREIATERDARRQKHSCQITVTTLRTFLIGDRSTVTARHGSCKSEGSGKREEGRGKWEEGAKMDTNWKHQKNAITTDQKNRTDDEHIHEIDNRHLK